MTPPDPLIDKVVVGRYRLLQRLGKGGMGAVYSARQLSMDRGVAIKLIHPSLAGDPSIAARFHREMQATSRVEHPNTVQVFDYGQAEDGQLFLVMELLQGRTLAQVLQAEIWLPAQRLRPIAAQIVRALGAAHAQGIVHRDLKPENVMLVDRFGERDFVKVLDFGIAHFLAAGAGSPRMTIDGSLIGTPAYMSPEQARGEAVGPKSDLYSLGVLLYQAAVGLPPFEGSTLPEILLRHLEQAPRPPSQIAPGRLPKDLEELVLALLEKDPARRPASAEAVLARLTDPPPLELEPTSLRPGGTPPSEIGGAPWGGSPSGPGVAGLAHPAYRVSAPEGAPAPGQRTMKPNRGPAGPAAVRARSPTPASLSASAPPSVAPVDAPRDPPRPAPPEARAGAWKAPAIVGAALLVLALGAAGLLSRWDGAADPGERQRLDRLLAATEDPAAPEACRARRPEAVRLLARAAQLLEDGSPDSRRPQDFEALETLESQAAALEAEYWALKARASLYAGSPPEQIRQAADAAAQMCPGYALAHKLVGNALQRAGASREAKAAYERALAAEPSYLAPRANLGILALKEKDLSAAQAAFDEVLARKPGDFAVLLARSQARYLAGQSDRAIADLEAAAQARPDSPDAPLRLGRLWDELGRRDEARQAYCRARELGSAEAASSCPAGP
jgi:serine/threonine protein kinase/tetratricopeptide (TPR) repeat protein